MKKIICFIFGHSPYTYDAGSIGSPEQAWACNFCNNDLTQGDEFWGLNLNSKVTKYLVDRKTNSEVDENDMPF